MNKSNLLKTKHSMISLAWIAAIAIGSGLIGFALLNIFSQQAETENTYASAVQATDIQEPQAEQMAAVAATEVSYAEYPDEGDIIGTLTIPNLDLEVSVLQGTGNDELKKGVGHYLDSVLPGEADNCVISGHRDTAFAKLGELTIGDLLIVQTSAGTFTYAVSDRRIVDKDDRTVIVPTDHAVLTLTTCYPFDYVGSAPDRYIVSADLVE